MFWKVGARPEVAQGQAAFTGMGSSPPTSGCPATEGQDREKAGPGAGHTHADRLGRRDGRADGRELRNQRSRQLSAGIREFWLK